MSFLELASTLGSLLGFPASNLKPAGAHVSDIGVLFFGGFPRLIYDHGEEFEREF